MPKRVWQAMAAAVWAVLIVVMGAVFYLNHYTPRGPMYDTGDVVCRNDGRGPCGEAVREDMSNLGLTDWEQFLKGESSFLLILPLVILGAIVTDKANKAPR